MQEYFDYTPNKDKHAPLTLSVLGLVFSVFLGAGIILSILGIILSFTYKRNSGTRKWALALGIVGVVLSVLFILAMVFLCKGQLFNLDEYLKGVARY